MEKDDKKWYIKLLSLLNLETTTKHGRFNLAGTIIMAGFCILYTAGDKFSYAISTIADVVKTVSLGQDIHHEYKTVGVVWAAIPVIVVFVLCLIYLTWHEHKKK